MKNKLTKTLLFVTKQYILGITIHTLVATLGFAEISRAQSVYDVKIDVNAQIKTLEDVITIIQNKSDFVFAYNKEMARSQKGLKKLQYRNTSIGTILEDVGKTYQLDFRQVNSTITVIPPKNLNTQDITSSQVDITVTGKVTDDETGESLAGVNILVAGSTHGTITDIHGDYTLIVDENVKSLIFSYIGYQSQEVVLGDRDVIDIQLSVDSQALEEVVVVGYGEQRKSDITGSVVSVPKERLEMVPNLNIAQALQGALPGVMVQQTQAGAASDQVIMIRGRNSILASNDPLIVVDGVPYYGNIRDINVNDVESIEVLKDASAAAIYGSRGANGVILISTKEGESGKPKVAYDGRFSVQRFINVPDFMDGEEFYDFKEIREPGVVTASEQAIYDAGDWTDWSDLALRDGFSHQHNLSISGGTKNTHYYIGGGYLDVQGLAVTDDYERLTTRINLDTKVADWLTIGTRTQLAYDDMSGYPLDWNNIYRKNPLTTPYDENGDLTIYPWPEFTDIANPLEPLNYDNSDEAYEVVTNNYAIVEFPFVPGLSYRLNTGIRKKLIDVSTYMGRNTKAGLEARGIAETERTLHSNLVVENILSYKKSFGDHNVFLTGVYSYEENKSSYNTLVASGFPNDFLSFYSASQAASVVPGYNYTNTVLNSQMLRINYEYLGKYMLTLTGRRDGYSGFGADNKWGVFPSIAVGWNLAREDFFPATDLFDDLKLRVSYGENGNQAVGAYESISRMAEYNMISLGNSLPGYVQSKLGETNLGWESTKTLNIGLDYSLLSGRFSGDINYYRSNTTDLLLNRTISLVHGINSITQNIGETQNRGLELSLNSRNIVTGDFTWSSTGNVSWNRNEIVSLYGNLDENGEETNDLANAWIIGEPVFVNYDYEYIGVWQLDEADEAAEWDSEPGFAKLRDVDGDGEMTAEDRQIIGQKDPKFIWGLSNSFRYKNFNLEVFIHGVHGLTKENELLQDGSTSSEVRRNVMKKNWWTPDNPTNEFYANAINAGGMSGAGATIYEDASFVRIKDISLAYTFPSQLLGKSGLTRLRIYATGRNLFTFTDWTGSDPELNHGRGATPLQKEYVFGVNFEF